MKFIFRFWFVLVIFGCETGIDDPQPGSIPVADFIFQIQITDGRTINFASTSKDASYLIWDFGDQIGRGFTNSITYSFAKNGTYLVNLTAGNKAGINTKQVEITVSGRVDPVADFTLSFATISSQLRVGLVNTSVNAGSYLWNFGDGQTSNMENPGSHTYAQSGSYQIELAASSADGIVTRRKRISVSVVDEKKLFAVAGKTWKFKTTPYQVAAFPSPTGSAYFVLRNGSVAYESALQLCELNDRYSFTSAIFTNINEGDGRVLENRNECRTVASPLPASYLFRRKSLTSFVLDLGITYLGDIKPGIDGFVYELIELKDSTLVVSYVRADQINPVLLERVVMVFETE